MNTPPERSPSRRDCVATLVGLGAAWTAGAQTTPPPSEVLLTIAGKGVKRLSDKAAVASEAAATEAVDFTLAALAAMPQHTITTKAPWHDGVRTYSGPLLRDVLAAANAQASSARFIALNDYRADIPLEDARQYPVVLAIRLDGKPMLVRDKGPLFVMYPFDKHPELAKTKYFSRCVWQLHRIELI
jgi:hypothetical protein